MSSRLLLVRDSSVDQVDSDFGKVTGDLDLGGWTRIDDLKCAGQSGCDQQCDQPERKLHSR